MGRCEDCLHWAAPNEEGVEFGVCRLISEAARIGQHRAAPYEFSSRLASMAVDGKRYVDSELLTSPDFGCVEFEEG